MSDLHGEIASVLDFWFTETQPRQWFVKDAAFDAEIVRRFAGLHARAIAGDLSSWETHADGALALVIVLDQFSRNMFRDTQQAFAQDIQALAIAKRAIERGFDHQVDELRRSFFYLPFEHSEALCEQERAIALFEAMGNKELLEWAQKHKIIIERFGRFPHRNKVLGRVSSDEERDFLSQDGSSF
ncbi:MAG TPA: DUF924 family protein [Magnetovibrio sp.]